MPTRAELLEKEHETGGILKDPAGHLGQLRQLIAGARLVVRYIDPDCSFNLQLQLTLDAIKGHAGSNLVGLGPKPRQADSTGHDR